MKIIESFTRKINSSSKLLIGSIISCALLYSFRRFYLKKNRHTHSLTLGLGLAPISSLAHGLSKANDLFELGFNKVIDDPYDEDFNPNGVMQLGVADNLLCLDLVEQWVLENWNYSIGSDSGVGIKGLVPYQPLDGLTRLKLVMASFMSKIMGNLVFDPSQIVLTTGATPAIEILAFCLGNPGDAFLIPTPYYSGFDRDVERTGVSLIAVHCRSSDNFILSIDAFDQAYNKARNQGLNVPAIVLSNPSNPVGKILPKETLQTLLDFAREKNIHIISDEIFAGSVHRNGEFVSMVELVKENNIDKNRVHIIYGISKDLSLAGFRVGLIYTFNDKVLKAAKRMTRFSSISTPTQGLLIRMLSDEKFVDAYMETYRKRIKRMHDLFVAILERLEIRCSKSDAGLFCWADMSRLINPVSIEGELELWDKLLRVGKVFMIPGSDFHCIEPGWFRCCFSSLSEKDVPLALERIQKVRDIIWSI